MRAKLQALKEGICSLHNKGKEHIMLYRLVVFLVIFGGGFGGTYALHNYWEKTEDYQVITQTLDDKFGLGSYTIEKGDDSDYNAIHYRVIIDSTPQVPFDVYRDYNLDSTASLPAYPRFIQSLLGYPQYVQMDFNRTMLPAAISEFSKEYGLSNIAPSYRRNDQEVCDVIVNLAGTSKEDIQRAYHEVLTFNQFVAQRYPALRNKQDSRIIFSVRSLLWKGFYDGNPADRHFLVYAHYSDNTEQMIPLQTVMENIRDRIRSHGINTSHGATVIVHRDADYYYFLNSDSLRDLITHQSPIYAKLHDTVVEPGESLTLPLTSPRGLNEHWGVEEQPITTDAYIHGNYVTVVACNQDDHPKSALDSTLVSVTASVDYPNGDFTVQADGDSKLYQYLDEDSEATSFYRQLGIDRPLTADEEENGIFFGPVRIKYDGAHRKATVTYME